MSVPAHAAPSNQTINFSARLKNATGGVVRDGYYNIDFNLYTTNSGGSSVWSETYHDTNGTSAGQDNRVRVVNGYFNVKLGSVEEFENVDWNDDLWLTMNVGDTDQIADSGDIPWDGEMSPRIQLSAVPYSMNSNAIGGKSVDELVQLGQGTQSDSSNNSSLSINKTGIGSILNLQADGADIFTLDKLGDITLGSGATDHSISVGSASTGAGRDLSLSAGSTTDSESGGTLILQGGSTSGLAAGGGVQIDTGTGNTGGSIVLGGDNAASVDIGNETSTTTVKGTLGANAMTLGSNTNEVAGQLNIASGTGFVANISSGGLTENQELYLPNETGTICVQNSAGCGFLRLNAGEVQSGNISLSGGASFGTYLSINTAMNRSGALLVRNADNLEVFRVDTSNDRIVLGTADTTGTLLVLDTKTDEGDPTGVNGAMYYSSDRGKMRCYENDAWEDCLSNTKGVPTTKTENYTAKYGDFIIANSSDAPFTITLPEPRAGAVISVKKINAGNAITVTCPTADIDNLNSTSLSSQWVSQDYYSDGTQWYRV